jgi:Ca2+-binding EF-hand superfamily protein
VSKVYLSIAAIAAFGAAVPALATATQATAPRAAAPAAAQAPPNRAAMIKNLDGAFKSIDTNGDGTLNAAELGAAESKVQQRRVAQLRGQYDANFAKLDTNKDGQLSKAEFMVAAPRTPATPPNGANLVTQLDKNKDGKVSADEYRTPVLARFDALDANKDGTISAAERQAAQTNR